jgi:hypothetical protein
VRQRFDDLGIQIAPLDHQTPEALRDLQKAEAARWRPIVKGASICRVGKAKRAHPFASSS